jgi:hypothetical protein
MGRCMMRARHEGGYDAVTSEGSAGYDAVTSEGSAGFSDGCQACQRRARRTMVVVRRIESGMSGMGKRLLSHPCHRCLPLWKEQAAWERRAEAAARQRAACSRATTRPTTLPTTRRHDMHRVIGKQRVPSWARADVWAAPMCDSRARCRRVACLPRYTTTVAGSKMGTRGLPDEYSADDER